MPLNRFYHISIVAIMANLTKIVNKKIKLIVKPKNICTPPVGAVSNRTEFGVKLITESTIFFC